MVESTGFEPFALQTGNEADDGRSTYAVSMSYDQENQEVTIVGGSYSHSGIILEPNCFVSTLGAQDGEELAWISESRYGNPTVAEFCSDLHTRGNNKGVVAVGYSGESGIFSHLLPYGDSRRSVYGIILDVDRNMNMNGGRLLHDSEMEYPVAVTADDSGDTVYVTSIFSEQSPASGWPYSSIKNAAGSGGADVSASGYSHPSPEASFSLRVQQFTTINATTTTVSSGISETFHPGWSREYGTVDLVDVQVSSLEYLSSSALLMAGYTTGNGTAFGQATSYSTGTYDSFAILLDPSTGHMIHTKRFASLTSGDDKILGSCHNNSTEAYLVGMTSGTFDSTYLASDEAQGTQAFILKVSLGDMTVLWSRQLGGSLGQSDTDKLAQVHGLACTVTPDGEEVFLAGNVLDGAFLTLPGEQASSSGSTDIFVAKFDSNSGSLKYAVQFGSEGVDTVGSGNSLATDSNGNLLLVGNTNGPMFRERQSVGATNVFIMSIGRETGDFVVPIANTTSTQISEEGFLTTFFSGESNPVRQARFQNTMAASLTILCLLVVAWFFSILRGRRAAHSRAKGEAVAEATLESSDWRSSMVKLREAQAVYRDTWHQALEPYAYTTGGNGAVMLTENSEMAGYSGRKHKTNERFKQSGGTAGTKKSSVTNLSIGSAGRDSTGLSNTYGEIYDLLEAASSRLAAGSEKNELTMPPPRNKQLTRINMEEDLTLDDIWNMEII